MKTPSMLLRIEVQKAVKRRAFWVTIGVFAAFIVLDAVIAVRVATERTNMPFALPQSWSKILEMPAHLGPFILGMLLILLVAPEFSWRTGRQNVIDGLSKERFYGGKLLLSGVLVPLFLVLPLVIGGAVTVVGPSESGSPFVRPTDFSYMIGYGVLLLMVGSAALMLACQVRSTGPAMGVLLGYALIENFIGELLVNSSGVLDRVAEYFPFAVFRALAAPLVYYPKMLASTNASHTEWGQEPLEFLDLEVLIIAALVYAAIFLATGFLSLRKRDM